MTAEEQRITESVFASSVNLQWKGMMEQLVGGRGLAPPVSLFLDYSLANEFWERVVIVPVD